MSSMRAPAPPKAWELVVYGFLTLPLAVTGLPLAIYIAPFYASEVGLPLTTVGVVIMLARVADVVVDPMIGILSDRRTTRWGRRRPWILAGMAVMMVGTWRLFVPVPLPGASAGYLLLWIFVLYVGWSLLGIPYAAWGAEMSTDYHERSRITGAREAFSVLGLIVSAVVPYVAAVGGPPGLAPGLRALAVLTVVLLPIGTLVLLTTLREPPRPPSVTTALAWRQGLGIVWRNEPFRRLLIASVLGGLAAAINQAVAVLFYVHVLRLPASAQALVLIYFLVGVLAIPFWVTLSKRITKHRALAISGLWGCAWFLVAPWLPPEEMLPVAILNVMTGISMAVPAVLGGSMAADVVDLDMIESGEPRAALFFSLWGIGTKLALALGIGMALPLLDLVGFTTAGPNGPTQLWVLSGLFCLLPVAIWLVSIWAIWRFPITPERQTALREEIARRAATA